MTDKSYRIVHVKDNIWWVVKLGGPGEPNMFFKQPHWEVLKRVHCDSLDDILSLDTLNG